MRIAIALCLTVAACGNPPDAKRPTGGSGSAIATNNPTGKPTVGGGPGVLKDVGCPAFSCAYHPGVNQYFTCLNGGAGTCFHFGGACMPDAACMYDSVSKSYKACAKGAEGLCQTWGTACAPTSRCMLDPTDNLHRHCDDLAGGTCRKFGALCAP
ncbi:MAG: hypothetical protein H0V17_13060 [Deltaproteobacteria bacterium]|nr:hypothetical protein [Deltaproteobacteria bacterium]